MRPGLYRSGTTYQSKGRYYDADLARWYAGTLQPIRGWRLRGERAGFLVDELGNYLTDESGNYLIIPAELVVEGRPRAAIAWRDNVGTAWFALGTHTGLYASEAAVAASDITPVGFSTGRADAEARVGYGSGDYGAGAYGTPRQETESSGILPATMWSLDTWGEYLVACAPSDGRLLEWTLNVSTPAAVIANAPTGCRAVSVTAERIMFALGAGGDPRRLDWSDQEDNTDWTPVATNQAGSFTFQTPGELMCGRRVRGGHLLITSSDAWLATYLGPPLVYGFQRVGADCGIVSPNAVGVADTFAAWMGQGQFWIYDGYVKPLPCEVHDAVFSDINTSQISKVVAVVQRKFGEVWWFYPSNASVENDRAVIWNYRENTWTFARIPRTCGDDTGVFELPLLVSPTGEVYEHEVGFEYVDYPGAAAGISDDIQYGPAYVEGGPVELGVGESTFLARKLYPDERTQGQVQVRFFAQYFPNGPVYEHGPYTAALPTNVRFTARQVRVRFEAVSGDWRIGNYRLEGKPGGTR